MEAPLKAVKLFECLREGGRDVGQPIYYPTRLGGLAGNYRRMSKGASKIPHRPPMSAPLRMVNVSAMVDASPESKVLEDYAQEFLVELDGIALEERQSAARYELHVIRRVVQVLADFAAEPPLDVGGERAQEPLTQLIPEPQVRRLVVLVMALRDALHEDGQSLPVLIQTRRQLSSELVLAIKTASSEVATTSGDGASRFLRNLENSLGAVAALDALGNLSDRAAAAGGSQDRAAAALAAAVAAAAEARTAQEESAGDVAESELAKEFAEYGNRQQVTGYIWLAVAVVLFAAAVVVGVTLLREAEQAFDWHSLATRLLIALPCFGLGAYCARESSRHRELAQWVRRIAVQLKSVGAYAARLDDVSRLTLLAHFGSYVFGPHPLGKDDNQVQPVPPELWTTLADVIRSRGDARA
jgi:hypothetical protein